MKLAQATSSSSLELQKLQNRTHPAISHKAVLDQADVPALLLAPHDPACRSYLMGVPLTWWVSPSPGGCPSHLVGVLPPGGCPSHPQLITPALVGGRIRQLSEWAQCAVLELVVKYVQESHDEVFDIMNLLEDRLQHANSAVVLGAAKVFLHLTLSMPEVHLQVRHAQRCLAAPCTSFCGSPLVQ